MQTGNKKLLFSTNVVSGSSTEFINWSSIVKDQLGLFNMYVTDHRLFGTSFVEEIH